VSKYIRSLISFLKNQSGNLVGFHSRTIRLTFLITISFVSLFTS